MKYFSIKAKTKFKIKKTVRMKDAIKAGFLGEWQNNRSLGLQEEIIRSSSFLVETN